ncbi:hypothetical protein [Collinsella sp. SGI.241]|uniref:hypothetical protein n=1 Tax=Collinsella sp. SGI.241 TaxID=3420557 RepID=UPI003D014C21
MSKTGALVADTGVGCVDLDGPRVMSSQMGFTHFRGDKKWPGLTNKTEHPTIYQLFLTFPQIKPAKINLSLFGRLVEGGLG